MSELAYYKGGSSNEWTTPPDLFARLHAIWRFNLDPAATRENALCPAFYTAEDDGLAQDWSGQRVFLNPPYSGGQIKKWMKKASEEGQKPGTVVVCLVPAKTGPAWWQQYVLPFASYIYYIPGRLKFGGMPGPAPFDSAIVVFGRLGGQL